MTSGYDIPSGVNPLTQLHEQEMVLPKEQANAVRDMARGDGPGGDTHLHVYAMDTKGVKQFFGDHAHHIAAALRGQNSRFGARLSWTAAAFLPGRRCPARYTLTTSRTEGSQHAHVPVHA